MTNAELGKYLARELFKVGDGPETCTRIQFMSGDWHNGTEKDQGGLSEAPLARELAQILDRANATEP